MLQRGPLCLLPFEEAVRYGGSYSIYTFVEILGTGIGDGGSQLGLMARVAETPR